MIQCIFCHPTVVVISHNRRVIAISDSRCDCRQCSHLRANFTHRPYLIYSRSIIVILRGYRVSRYSNGSCLIKGNVVSVYRCRSICSGSIGVIYTSSRILTRCPSISRQVQRLRSCNRIAARNTPNYLAIRSICSSAQCNYLLFTGSKKRYRVTIRTLRLRRIEELDGISAIVTAVIVKSI